MHSLARGELRGKAGELRVEGPVRSNMDESGYAERFSRIQEYIRAGDCYQINLARRFSVAATGDAWPAYLELRRRNPAPFAAFLTLVLEAYREQAGRMDVISIPSRVPDPAH